MFELASVVVVLVGTGVVLVELGNEELELGRLMYLPPRTPSNFWTDEMLSFELRYVPLPSI